MSENEPVHIRQPPLFPDRAALLMTVAILGQVGLAHGQQASAPPPSLGAQNAREAFLAKARVVTDAPGDGRPIWRATLDDGTQKHDASVNAEDGSGPTRRNYRYNVAAYELDKLLGLNLVLVSVERSMGGRPASVIWWLDDFAMNELDRRRKKIECPDADAWARQVQAVRVFDELIANAYRDPSPPLYLNSVWDNLLITTDWSVWLTDHTGAFRTRRELQDPGSLVRCPRAVLSRLRTLNRDRLGQALQRYLSVQQLDALEARRALIVKHFDGEVAGRGEAAVLYDLPRR
jgi:hypothetical protein